MENEAAERVGEKASDSGSKIDRGGAKGRRCTIDLTPAASEEVARMCKEYDLKIADLFRYGLLLMRIYGEAVQEGKQMRLVSRKDPSDVQVVELPIFRSRGS